MQTTKYISMHFAVARAVAGEASVLFFHAAGPEFDEVLVGQGARRVRDQFSKF